MQTVTRLRSLQRPAPLVAFLRLAAAVLAITLLAAPAEAARPAGAQPPVVELLRAGTVVDANARVALPRAPLPAEGDAPVLLIEGRDDGTRVEVDLGGGVLIGGTGKPHEHAGTGILIRGRNVTLRNGTIRGFKVGVRAIDCDGLILEDLVVSDNHAQRLRSKPWAEDSSDWLFPHRNDDDEWAKEHGAGIAVRNAHGAVIRRITSHRTQNGILLDRVRDSQVYDNDCSFLSGWGIAMWRSSGNTICRNSLDFCIRGYSHGVYNRGQDSAGLLMFEQCSDNIVALNSATHGGDGIFGFAGREALGEAPKADAAADWHKGRGNNRNMFLANDLSFAAAHGLEITFSFGNIVARNRFESNAICGVWGGYSRDTVVAGNTFVGNGRVMQGSERGGINMEHAQRTVVHGNGFENEPVGVRFWTDADEHLAKLPWARTNGMGAASNIVAANTFNAVDNALELVAAKETLFAGNTVVGGKVAIADEGSTDTQEEATAPARAGPTDAEIDPVIARLPGERQAVGLRSSLRGREKIVMLEHGPYAWETPIVVQTTPGIARVQFKAYGLIEVESADVIGRGPLFAGVGADAQTIEVASSQSGFVAPFTVQARDQLRKLAKAKGLLAPGQWATKVFTLDGGAAPLAAVPTRDAFLARAAEEPRELELRELALDFRGRAPREVIDHQDAPLLSAEGSRFGLVSRSPFRFPPGRYSVVVESDDGIRVRIDGETVIERWDIHAPTIDRHEFEVAEMRELAFEVEYFQNTGHSTLRVWFEEAGGASGR
jgi:parallel beta-helix repeat protein